MQLGALDLGLDGVFDHSVLLNQRFALEGFTDHHLLEVATVTGHPDLGAGDAGLDQGFDFVGFHRAPLAVSFVDALTPAH